MGTLVPKALPERRRALQYKTKRYNPALAMGAVCADGALVLNHELIRWLNIGGARLDDVIAVERAKSQRLDKAYRNDALRLELRDKFAVLVDDGMTTASAMHTAIAILRLRQPARIVIAVPVASHSSVLDLRFSSTGLPRSPEAEELVRQQPVRWRADGRCAGSIRRKLSFARPRSYLRMFLA
jgi:Phosphoribosyl transferase domain